MMDGSGLMDGSMDIKPQTLVVGNIVWRSVFQVKKYSSADKKQICYFLVNSFSSMACRIFLMIACAE